MKTPRIALLVGIAVCAATAARPEASQASNSDLASLQGEWTMVSGVADGYAVPDAMLRDSKRTCEGNVTTVIVGGQLIMKARFTLDPSKTPKTVDYQVIDGPTKGKQHLGIYELDGDTVKYCFGEPGGARPTEFGSQPGDRRTSSVWKRAKPAPTESEKK